MTREQNIRAILEGNFAVVKDEIIDIAVKNIMSLSQEPNEALLEVRATVNSWAHDIDVGVEAGDAYYDVLDLIDSKIKEQKSHK